ncbi:hypothetical protein [Mucilaginibacter sp. SJ]|uniref:hypothetical protein n=1 Tax=Mucilaginibacter sp. SJ TaxID=3029053 RepID=UPI0023A95AC8|nr:hypothetical protein [Mucilaginibacter sp. SJ]WEA03844.1 hypothetical protein MusilaSJ_12955 [Mucilaginibacter sp. SJ]
MPHFKAKKVQLVFALLILNSSSLFAQTQPYSIIDNLHPVTPTAFQFTKYTEMPVSEYTGIPEISVPLYNVTVDDVTLPLNLTYHAAGNRVNQEASWVGLGWDLQVGSIVQQINDQDDYASTDVSKRRLPDFYNNGIPYEFPFRFRYCDLNGTGNTVCNFGCSGPISINAPTTQHGFVIYTDSYAPFKGYYNTTSDFFGDHNSLGIDSEPDIFTASFFGHSIKFIDDWTATGHVPVVLNKKGYVINRVNDTWQIIVPNGDQFFFEVKSTVQTKSSSELPTRGTVSYYPLPSSNMWLLTKIITRNKKQILFNYSQTTPNNCYPTFTQKKIIAALSSTYLTSSQYELESACVRGVISNDLPSTGICSSWVESTEPTTTLSSIVFPNGNISFSTSNRDDVLGGKKLDRITVNSASQVIKSFDFNYDYFNSSGVGGNVYNGVAMSGYGNCPFLRLKLNSLRDNSGAAYLFNYNTTLLPAKNSYAIDYWGFYNGQGTNTSAVPNPTQFNRADLGDNGDNHSANVNFCQASILQQIVYPTGGKLNYTYELNQFDNYIVPDFTTNTNTVSSGLGLRIKSTQLVNKNNVQLKKTTYSYEGGKAMLPLQFFRHYNYTVVPPGNLPTYGQALISRTFSMDEINMNGFFSSSPLMTVNGVGYYKVTKTDVDGNNIAKGSTVTIFSNHPETIYTGVNSFNQLSATLPSIKSTVYADNGSVNAMFVYDSNNTLLKKISNSYTNINSALYYGARLFGYGQLVRWSSYSGTEYQNGKLQSLVGYFPLYDFESLLSSSTETDYFGTDSLKITSTKYYDSNNLLATERTTSSDGKDDETDYVRPFTASIDLSYTPHADIVALRNANRLNELLVVLKMRIDPIKGPRFTSRLDRKFKSFGSLILPIRDSLDTHPGLGLPSVTKYDQYDLGNGNILQFTDKQQTNSVIWDYNKEYVIGQIKNSDYASVAYTSFESDGTGRWKYAGFPLKDILAPAGKSVYSLSTGAVYRDSLSTSKTYIVSYWSKNGQQTVSNSTSVTQGYTYNGYTYYEHAVTYPTGGTVTISGTGTIDELRLYPTDSQMSTFVYEPLLGITSQTDVTGKITYYEYDASKRLMNIKDQAGNIVKHIDYHVIAQ